MTSLAVVVSSGSTNALVQVVTLLMAAVHSDLAARVLFRDASLLRLTPEGIRATALSPEYAGREEAYAQRLQRHELADLRKALADIKASGDVKLYACSSSLALAGLTREDLIPEVDAVRGMPAFLLEDMATADRTLTF